MGRYVLHAMPLAALALLASCGGGPTPSPAGDGVLVLEVGGDQASLRQALIARGRVVEPPILLSSSPEAPPPVAPYDPSQVTSDPSIGPQPDAPMPPTPEPDAQWRYVELRRGETLIHVARRHLGDGRRYLELLEWNGWTDEDARRLKEGQKVRLKAAEAR